MKQDESLSITAIRETFEESGLLLASSAPGSSPHLPVTVLEEARHAIHEQRTLFQAFLTEHDLKADINSLLPFTQWITPVGAPRYVRTRPIKLGILTEMIQTISYTVLRHISPSCSLVGILLGSQRRKNSQAR